MPDRFLQIHTLTPYAGVLLNRDDAGYAKRMKLGGAVRTRVSSQCLKRHWRTHEGDHALSEIEGVEMAVRSRHSIEMHVKRPLLDEYPEAHVDLVVRAVMEAVVGKPDLKSEDRIQSGQIVVLGHPELNFMAEFSKQLLRNTELEGVDEKKRNAALKKELKARLKGEAKKNLHAIGHAAGLDAALFGRMVTSDILARGDAAIHVAHAFTVHEEESEDDFFSAIDDLLDQVSDEQQGLGSGHIGNVEINSGLFYSYVVVDIPLLVSNLTGAPQSRWTEQDRSLAAEVVRRLVRIISTVSPGAKLGSTAPYAHAQAMLVESGSAQPRSLAGAFLDPVRNVNPLAGAYRALGRHVADMDAMYDDMIADRAMAAVSMDDAAREQIGVGELRSLAGLADWAAQQVLA